jgi:hypothetical protein
MTSCRNYCDVKRGDPGPGICTRTTAFYVLSKDETTNFGQVHLYFGWVRAACRRYTSARNYVNQTSGTFHKSL